MTRCIEFSNKPGRGVHNNYETMYLLSENFWENLKLKTQVQLKAAYHPESDKLFFMGGFLPCPTSVQGHSYEDMCLLSRLS